MMTGCRARLCVGLLTWAAGGSHAQVAFSVLTVPPGFSEFYVQGMSPDGSVIVGATGDHPTVGAPFRWSEAYGFVPLPSITGAGSAFAASSGGTMIVGAMVDTQTAHFASVWDSGGSLPLPFSCAYAVSDDGRVIVGQGEGAVRWTQESGAVALGGPAAWSWSCASDVSADGAVVVGTGQALGGPFEAFRWTDAGAVELLGSVPGELSSSATAISGAGTTIVGQAAGQPARWTRRHGFHLLTEPRHGVARAVSDDGWRVVGSFTFPQGGTPFVWDPVRGGRPLQDLLAENGVPLGSFVLTTAEAISSDGAVLAGQGYTPPSAAIRTWVARIPPFCYANCDGSTTSPVLNVSDFTCFLRNFAAGEIYGNCDNDGALNIADFACFLQKFTAGCN